MRARFGMAVILIAASLVVTAGPGATYSGKHRVDLLFPPKWNAEPRGLELTFEVEPSGGVEVLEAGVHVLGSGTLGPVRVPLAEGKRGVGGLSTVVATFPWFSGRADPTFPLDLEATARLLNSAGRQVATLATFAARVLSPTAKVVGSLDTQSGSGNAGNPAFGGDDFKGGPGCSIQCITSGIAYARGVGTYLEVKTDTPASIRIGVVGHGEFASGPGLQEFGHTWPDLQPNTTYEAYARATDSDGHESSAEGAFTTLRRFARVEFGPFTLAAFPEQNDDFFAFIFRVANEWRGELSDANSEPAYPNPDPFGPGNAVVVEDAPEFALDIAVRVSAQADTNEQTCEADPTPLEDYSDSGFSDPDDCPYEAWGTGVAPYFALDQIPPDETTWVGPHTLEGYHASTPGDHPVQFNAPITVVVWYE